jgi:hypothetical protein
LACSLKATDPKTAGKKTLVTVPALLHVQTYQVTSSMVRFFAFVSAMRKVRVNDFGNNQATI